MATNEHTTERITLNIDIEKQSNVALDNYIGTWNYENDKKAEISKDNGIILKLYTDKKSYSIFKNGKFDKNLSSMEMKINKSGINFDIIVVIILNFVIALIGILAYSVRIVGVKTGKISISSALFNSIALFSRTANVFQAPKLTKFVELNGNLPSLINIFYLIIFVILISSVIGMFLIPTFQRLFSKAVESFSIEKSFNKLILHSFSKSGIKHLKESIKIPDKKNIKSFKFNRLPAKILIFNTIANALLTAGVFAPIYAGSLNPELRATCIQLSAVVNGFATIFLAILIDPYLSVLTDDVLSNKYSENDYRKCVVEMIISRILGIVISFFILVPAAYAIIFFAKIM